jgi:hypothetical protein
MLHPGNTTIRHPFAVRVQTDLYLRSLARSTQRGENPLQPLRITLPPGKVWPQGDFREDKMGRAIGTVSSGFSGRGFPSPQVQPNFSSAAFYGNAESPKVPGFMKPGVTQQKPAFPGGPILPFNPYAQQAWINNTAYPFGKPKVG